MPDLKPCPFCGATGEDVSANDFHMNGLRTFAVGCRPCALTGPLSGNEAQAIEAWNRRAPVADAVRDMFDKAIAELDSAPDAALPGNLYGPDRGE